MVELFGLLGCISSARTRVVYRRVGYVRLKRLSFLSREQWRGLGVDILRLLDVDGLSVQRILSTFYMHEKAEYFRFPPVLYTK